MGRQCLDKNCTRQAVFNLPGETKGKWCKQHKANEMMDVVNPKCQYEDCFKQPGYNYPGEKKGIYCKVHKLDDMIDIKDRKYCEQDGCKIRPTFNFSDKTDAIYCVDHKKSGMINVLENRLCKDCTRRAHYGEVLNLPEYCKEHKKDGMKWVEKKLKCQFCDKVPTYGYEKPTVCREHKNDDMKDVRHILCKTPLCEVRPVKAGYCSRCYIYMFPDSKVTRNFKTKELAVREFLVTKFPNITLNHDKRVDCFLYRPDFSIDMGTHIIIIEVDENQHETYDSSCENKRLMSIFQSFGARPLVMIRFNPDKFDNVKGCWTKDCKIRDTVKWKDRLEQLNEKVSFSMHNVPKKEVSLIHLFYDKV